MPYYYSKVEEEGILRNKEVLISFLDPLSSTTILVATIALIVGIDYKSIKVVIFMPTLNSLINTIQGIGRIRGEGKAYFLYYPTLSVNFYLDYS